MTVLLETSSKDPLYSLNCANKAMLKTHVTAVHEDKKPFKYTISQSENSFYLVFIEFMFVLFKSPTQAFEMSKSRVSLN